MIFGGDDFVVAVAVTVVAVVVNSECSDFVALAAGSDAAAVHASFDDLVLAVTEIVVVVVDTDLI